MYSMMYPLRRIVNNPFDKYNIQSYGIVLYSIKSKKYVMVSRRHSIDFVLLMKGRYEKANLPVMVKGMTSEEIEIIETCINSGTELFVQKMRETVKGYRNYSFTLNKFNDCKEMIRKLLQKLKDMSYVSPELQWGFPKGILGNGEGKLTCAYREFEEEVGFKISDKILNIVELREQQYVTYSSKKICVTCWLIMQDEEQEIEKVDGDDEEVSDRKWMDKEEVMDVLTVKRSCLLENESDVVHSCIMYKNIFEEASKYVEEYRM